MTIGLSKVIYSILESKYGCAKKQPVGKTPPSSEKKKPKKQPKRRRGSRVDSDDEEEYDVG